MNVGPCLGFQWYRWSEVPLVRMSGRVEENVSKQKQRIYYSSYVEGKEVINSF